MQHCYPEQGEAKLPQVSVINVPLLHSLKHLQQRVGVSLIRWVVLSVKDVNVDFNMFLQKPSQMHISRWRKRQIPIAMLGNCSRGYFKNQLIMNINQA